MRFTEITNFSRSRLLWLISPLPINLRAPQIQFYWHCVPNKFLVQYDMMMATNLTVDSESLTPACLRGQQQLFPFHNLKTFCSYSNSKITGEILAKRIKDKTRNARRGWRRQSTDGGNKHHSQNSGAYWKMMGVKPCHSPMILLSLPLPLFTNLEEVPRNRRVPI